MGDDATAPILWTLFVLAVVCGAIGGALYYKKTHDPDRMNDDEDMTAIVTTQGVPVGHAIEMTPRDNPSRNDEGITVHMPTHHSELQLALGEGGPAGVEYEAPVSFCAC